MPITLVLENAGLQVVGTTSGIEVPYTLYKSQPDLVIVVEDLPSLIIQNFCWRLRQVSSIPIIVLGTDLVASSMADMLEAGADAYMSKFSSFTKLIARVRSLLRRSKEKCCNFYTNTLFRELTEYPVNLGNVSNNSTPTDFSLDYCLMVDERRLMANSEPTFDFWGGRQESKDSFEFCIRYLQQKLSHATNCSDDAVNPWGDGYHFCRNM